MPSAPLPTFPHQPVHSIDHPSRQLLRGVTPHDPREQFLYVHDPLTSREYYIIGTVHTRAASAKDVQQVMELVKPQTICLELDEERAQALDIQLAPPTQNDNNHNNNSKEQLGSPISVLWNGDSNMSMKARLAHWYGNTMYQQAAKQDGVQPGLEFKVG